jgi:phosphotriesterase-related protein
VEAGSYIGFDRIGMDQLQPDEVRADNLVRLVRSGYRANVMLSHDRFCGWLGKPARQLSPAELARRERLTAAGDWPPRYTYLFTEFVPMLRARGMADSEIFSILDENPRRFFAGEPLPLPNA